MQSMRQERAASWAQAIIFSGATWILLMGSIMPVSSAVEAPQPLVPVEVPVETVVDSSPDEEEILWLARCIYSETKRPLEQELVAWVVRNRVESGYRGRRTYRGAVLDPWQFSAFNPSSPKRDYLMSLDETSRAPGFQEAIRIARWVVLADAEERPFSRRTRHFYSERSMLDGTTPEWAVDVRPVSLDRQVDPRRFRFYDQVA